MVTAALRCLVELGTLSPEALEAAFQQVMLGTASTEAIAGLLTALRLKGETADDLVALARVTRSAMVSFDVGNKRIIDTCGTGGDGAGTFNISTAAAILIAAAGQPVVKHGNRGFSSSTGSADVIEALGVEVDVHPDVMRACFEHTGFAFCFTPRYHPAARHAAAARKALGFRTIFNLLGPLVNPARAPHQVIGVGRSELLPLVADALRRLGTMRSVVLHSEDGLDEASPQAITRFILIEGNACTERSCDPDEYGLQGEPMSLPKVSSPTESAAHIEEVLSGKAAAGTRWVLANAALGLWIAGLTPTLAGGVDLARDVLATGAARDLLERLRQRAWAKA